MPQPTDDPATPELFARRLLRIGVGVVAVLVPLLAAAALAPRWSLWPYVTADIALVALLCAVPFGVMASNAIVSRYPASLVLTGCVAALAIVPVLTTLAPSGEVFSIEELRWALFAIRAGLAVIAVTAGCAFALALLPPARSGDSSATAAGLPSLLIMLILAAGVAETYVLARCKGFASEVAESRSGSRYGDALTTARRLADLNPAFPVTIANKRKSASQLAANLQGIVDERRAGAERLKGDPRPAAQLQRARLLAQIGRTEEAIAILEPLAEDPTLNAAAALLLGAIHENAEEWTVSRSWYERVLTASQGKPDRRGDCATAMKGVAYNERKLGNYSQAADMYERLIEFAPTADHHFLLAQFYEDAQQATPAYRHAAEAKRLAPQRYAKSADELIEGLSQSQFGCFGVFREKMQSRYEQRGLGR